MSVTQPKIIFGKTANNKHK